MIGVPRFGFADWVCLLLVLGCAGGARAWYIVECAADGEGAPAFAVQGQGFVQSIPADDGSGASVNRTEVEDLAAHVRVERSFKALAPLSDRVEETAHVAPGYPWLLGMAGRLQDNPAMLVRWTQCVLGTLTVLCYFFFARRVFASTPAGTVAGLLLAVYPFWIINTAELADSVLASFLLAVSLALGARGSQVGGAFTSALFGLALAALAMVRAALLPFAIVAFLWYLARCRELRSGWFAALLALLGFANGLAPWALRNWQAFGEPVPVVDSAYLHLWMGNNSQAHGAALDEKTLRESLHPDLREALLAEKDQPRRYARLGPELLAELAREPSAALGHRIDAAGCFLLGESWFRDRRLARAAEVDDAAAPIAWVAEWIEPGLRGSLLVMLPLALLGWRWSARGVLRSRLAAIAAVWVPLPYLLSHAEQLSGPRLPLDGVLWCFAAFALVYLIPGLAPTPHESDVILPAKAAAP